MEEESIRFQYVPASVTQPNSSVADERMDWSRVWDDGQKRLVVEGEAEAGKPSLLMWLSRVGDESCGTTNLTRSCIRSLET